MRISCRDTRVNGFAQRGFKGRLSDAGLGKVMPAKARGMSSSEIRSTKRRYIRGPSSLGTPLRVQIYLSLGLSNSSSDFDPQASFRLASESSLNSRIRGSTCNRSSFPSELPVLSWASLKS